MTREEKIAAIKSKREAEKSSRVRRQKAVEAIKAKRDEVVGSGELASESPRINNMTGSISQFFKQKEGGGGLELAPQETEEERQLNRARTGLRGSLSLARGRPEAERDLVLAKYPNAKIEVDADGNYLATIPEIGAERQYINKPGLSKRDADQFMVSAAALAPAGRLVGVVGSVLGRMGIAGSLAAADSLGQDAVVNQMAGTEVSYSDAAVAFGLGGFFEGVAPMAVNAVMGALRRRKGLDNVVKEEFARAGINPDDLTVQQMDRLKELAEANPDEVVKGYNAEVAESFGIPQTRAMSEGTAGAAQGEAAMRTKRPDLFEKADAQAASAAQESAKGVMESFGPQGRRLSDEITSAGNIAGSGLREAEQASAQGVREAYKRVEDLDAVFDARPVREFAQGLRGQFKASEVDMAQFGGESTTPWAKQAIERLEAETSITIGHAAPAIEIQNLEAMRKLMNNYRGNTVAGSPDRNAMRRVMEKFDEFYDTVTDDLLISGKAGAIDAINDARSAFKEHKGKFSENKFGKGKDVAGRMVQKIIDDDLSGVQVTDLIFGRAAVGSKGESVKVVRRIKEAAGENSEAWQGVREAAIETIFRPDAAGGFNKERFLKDINRAIGGRGKEVLQELFTTEERQTLMRFRQEIAKSLPQYATETAMGLNRFADSVANGIDKYMKRRAAGEQLASNASGAWLIRQLRDQIDSFRVGRVLNDQRDLNLNPRTGLGALLSATGAAAGVQGSAEVPSIPVAPSAALGEGLVNQTQEEPQPAPEARSN